MAAVRHPGETAERPSDAAPGEEAVALADGTVLRPLAEHDDLRACVALQRRVWGEGFEDVTSPAILKIAQEVGGVAAGAFGAREGGAGGELLGFVFGLTGVRQGRPAHWSHMLAVAPEARGRDLGYHLKLYQRRLLLPLGVEVVRWTYDPLVSKNAYLNVARLGARPVRYVRDYYGPGDDSELSAGLGTDRFVVEWRIAEERVARLAERGAPEPALAAWREAPVANVREGAGGAPEPVAADPPDAPAVRVEVPPDVLEVRRRAPEVAARWRASTRQAFEALLARGYGVAGFYRETEQQHERLKRPGSVPAGAGGGPRSRSFYVLTRPPQ